MMWTKYGVRFDNQIQGRPFFFDFSLSFQGEWVFLLL